MQFIEALRLALQSLWANKMRSILTLLGVIIGVGSVITVVTLTNGAKQFVTSKINSYGAATITISKMPQTFITHGGVSLLPEAQGCHLRRLPGGSFRLQSLPGGGRPAPRDGQSRARHQVDHRHQYSRLDLDHARPLQSQHRAGPIVHAGGRRALLARGHRGRRHRRQRARGRRSAGQRNSRRRRALHRHRRGRAPGQDAGHEHG